MNLSYLVLKQVSIMLILMAVGYYAFRERFITPEGSKDLSSILLYVVTPAVTIKSFLIESTPERTRILFSSMGLGIIAILVTLIIAHLFYRNNRTLDFGVAFSNAGFIGIPLIYNTLGPEAVFFMLAFLTMSIITVWTYGIFIMTGKRDSISLAKIIRNPILTFVVIGLVLYFTQLKLPGLVVDTMNYITPLNTPLAMFVIGAMIAEIPFKSIFNDLRIYKAAFVRLILIPLVTGLIFVFIPGEGEQFALMKTAIFIVAAAPTAANTAIFANIFKLNPADGVKIVCLTTVFSILTIPVVVYMYESAITLIG